MTDGRLWGIACLVAMLAGTSATAHAEGTDIEDLMSLDIESLARVQVSTASKKSEDISEAPSVVSVITAEEIRRYGARNLHDVLDRATSIQAYGSSYYPDNVVSIRGGAMQIQNNHTLFLINGRPFRDSLTGGTVTTLLMGFPLNLVDTIEIIRGPGSVLYGSSAFNGVVNIKTKSPEKLGNAVVSATYGAFGTRSTDSVAAAHGEDWNLAGGVKITRADGWDMNVVDGAGTAGVYESDNKDLGLALSGNYKDFTFNIFRGKTSSANLSPSATYPVVDNGIPAHFIDLGYAFAASDKWTVNTNATYNDHRFYSAVNDRTFKSHDILLEVSTRGVLTETLSLLAGTTFENHESSQFNAFESNHWNTGYLQLESRPLHWLKLVGGVQLNKPADTPTDLSPRCAVIVNFDENWGMKMMYGKAFRSPNFVETAINSPGIITGNPDLTPETVQTAEIQLFYSDPAYQGSLTFYRNNMKSLITRVGFPIQFFNSRAVEFRGIELEGKARITRALSATGSASYQTSTDNLDRQETTYAPNIMAKAGLAYDTPSGITLGLYDSYFGDPSQVRDFQTVTERNPKPVSYHLMTFNASANLADLLKDPAVPNAAVSLFVDNLLDEDIRFPDLNTGAINSIPIHSGRAVYGTLTVKF